MSLRRSELLSAPGLHNSRELLPANPIRIGSIGSGSGQRIPDPRQPRLAGTVKNIDQLTIFGRSINTTAEFYVLCHGRPRQAAIEAGGMCSFLVLLYEQQKQDPSKSHLMSVIWALPSTPFVARSARWSASVPSPALGRTHPQRVSASGLLYPGHHPVSRVVPEWSGSLSRRRSLL